MNREIETDYLPDIHPVGLVMGVVRTLATEKMFKGTDLQKWMYAFMESYDRKRPVVFFDNTGKYNKVTAALVSPENAIALYGIIVPAVARFSLLFDACGFAEEVITAVSEVHIMQNGQYSQERGYKTDIELSTKIRRNEFSQRMHGKDNEFFLELLAEHVVDVLQDQGPNPF